MLLWSVRVHTFCDSVIGALKRFYSRLVALSVMVVYTCGSRLGQYLYTYSSSYASLAAKRDHSRAESLKPQLILLLSFLEHIYMRCISACS